MPFELIDKKMNPQMGNFSTRKRKGTKKGVIEKEGKEEMTYSCPNLSQGRGDKLAHIAVIVRRCYKLWNGPPTHLYVGWLTLGLRRTNIARMDERVV